MIKVANNLNTLYTTQVNVKFADGADEAPPVVAALNDIAGNGNNASLYNKTLIGYGPSGVEKIKALNELGAGLTNSNYPLRDALLGGGIGLGVGGLAGALKEYFSANPEKKYLKNILIGGGLGGLAGAGIGGAYGGFTGKERKMKEIKPKIDDFVENSGGLFGVNRDMDRNQPDFKKNLGLYSNQLASEIEKYITATGGAQIPPIEQMLDNFRRAEIDRQMLLAAENWQQRKHR